MLLFALIIRFYYVVTGHMPQIGRNWRFEKGQEIAAKYQKDNCTSEHAGCLSGALRIPLQIWMLSVILT